MTTIVRPLQSTELATLPADAVWQQVAREAGAWLAEAGVACRDAVVLLPFAQLLPLARRAFGVAGGFMPRIETTQTLAAALGPAAMAEAGQVSFDLTVDSLIADELLRSRSWGAAWALRDPRGFRGAVDSVIATAHALLRAAAAVPPERRQAHWAVARETLLPVSGPGSSERLLARVALEWAALAPAPASDRLYRLQPAAWIAVRAGGADPLADAILASASCPALRLDADAGLSLGELRWPVDAGPPTLAVCDGFEQEAQSAAAQVVLHLHRGEAPVALIAQDRVLVRRIRALLERDAVTVQDETGWKLSTTRAAALVMSLLKAARPDAASDALLDWLKALPNRDPSYLHALDAFEARLRRGELARVEAVDAAYARGRASPGAAGGEDAPPDEAASKDVRPDPPASVNVRSDSAASLWSAASAVLRVLAGAGQRPLPDWIDALGVALRASGAWPTMQEDDAGCQVLAALRLAPRTSSEPAWQLASAAVTMGLAGFTDWADRVLEQATFTPGVDPDLPVQVVVTPLPRAMLRPFAAVVFPGADDKHLGVAARSDDDLIGESQARAVGIADSETRRNAELLAFGQLLRAPRISFFRRRLDAAEPLAQSPLIARLALALRKSGGPGLAAWQEPRGRRNLFARPVHATAAAGADLLPERLSASACEALRACPYRFFALNMLRLGEDNELDGEVEKRDYGNWLHDVLHAFHAGRTAPDDPDVEAVRLHAIGDASRREHGIAAADFVPFAASFASFVPRYIAWLHQRDGAGWRWSGGEVERVVEQGDGEGLTLRGIIDRIDVRDAGGDDPPGDDPRPLLQLIDYKTGSVEGFKAKVAEPLEDTQLAFYAALMPAGSRLQAIYLTLDGSKGIQEIEHRGVAASAQALRDGLAHDVRRIRAGVALPTLGNGPACEHCDARGICRRDHWSPEAEPAA